MSDLVEVATILPMQNEGRKFKLSVGISAGSRGSLPGLDFPTQTDYEMLSIWRKSQRRDCGLERKMIYGNPSGEYGQYCAAIFVDCEE